MADLKDKVDAVFGELGRSAPKQQRPEPVSGWEMELPSGETAARSQLEHAAQPLIELGPDAAPELIRWAMAENLALRYVAVFALQEITGVKPHLAHFDKEDKEGHRRKAIAEWVKWSQQRTGR